MKVLVINAGSSSLKYQLMDPATREVFAKGLCERIGIDGRLTHKVPAKDAKYEFEIPMPTHSEAIQAVLDALPYEFYEQDKVRRYGFHGTSHRYVSARAAAMLGKPIEELKIITCHLGNGSSVAAVDGGKSVDTSMGFTPLAGVPMGTRAGDLDAGILEYLMGKHGYDMKEMMTILNKKSGVLGISGVSSDFRDLENAAKEGNQRAELALEAFQYSVKKLVGAYAAAMGGVDAIVFTAGVGENDAATRMAVASGLEFMGVKMDAEANNVRGKETVISSADSKVKVLLIPTDEELMIAMDTAEIVGK